MRIQRIVVAALLSAWIGLAVGSSPHARPRTQTAPPARLTLQVAEFSSYSGGGLLRLALVGPDQFGGRSERTSEAFLLTEEEAREFAVMLDGSPIHGGTADFRGLALATGGDSITTRYIDTNGATQTVTTWAKKKKDDGLVKRHGERVKQLQAIFPPMPPTPEPGD